MELIIRRLLQSLTLHSSKHSFKQVCCCMSLQLLVASLCAGQVAFHSHEWVCLLPGIYYFDLFARTCNQCLQ